MPPDNPAPRIRHLADTALSVEFDGPADPALAARIRAVDVAFARLPPAGVVETVPTYRGLTIHLDPLTADPAAVTAAVLRLADLPDTGAGPARTWAIPVVYGGEFGEDLDALAAQAGITSEAAIAAHAGADYTIAMVGFLPGFCYLSGLPATLSMPRRAEPRARIPASSISIGGQQTAIGSLAGPSGWHVIGRTPVRPFHPGRSPEFLLAAGDRIRFRPIPAADWAALDRDAARGAPVAERIAG